MDETNPYDTRHYFSRAFEFSHHHPGVAVSIAYLVVSIIGIMFSWSMFYQFDITYFHYADVSDFLLAAVREPATFLLATGAIVVAMLLIRFSYGTQRFYRKHMDRIFVFRWLYAIDEFGRTGFGFVLVLLAYTFLFITVYGDWKAGRIRNGNGIPVQVTMTSESENGLQAAAGHELLLLGTTSRYVFLYSPEAGQSFIIPSENIAALRPSPADGEPAAPPSIKSPPATEGEIGGKPQHQDAGQNNDNQEEESG